VHSSTHEGEKCFSCAHCDYACLTQRMLDMHTLVHRGASFACDVEGCGARFK